MPNKLPLPCAKADGVHSQVQLNPIAPKPSRQHVVQLYTATFNKIAKCASVLELTSIEAPLFTIAHNLKQQLAATSHIAIDTIETYATLLEEWYTTVEFMFDDEQRLLHKYYDSMLGSKSRRVPLRSRNTYATEAYLDIKLNSDLHKIAKLTYTFDLSVGIITSDKGA